MKLRRGENSSLPCCTAVHTFGIFFNSEFNNHNLKNTLRYECPISDTYICIFSDMNQVMLKKLKTSENLGNFGRYKVMLVGLTHLPFSVHRAFIGMLVESLWDFFSKTKSLQSCLELIQDFINYLTNFFVAMLNKQTMIISLKQCMFFQGVMSDSVADYNSIHKTLLCLHMLIILKLIPGKMHMIHFSWRVTHIS